MKRILYPLSAILFAMPAHAVGPYCALASSEFETIANVTTAPQYFAKAHSNGEYVFYIANEGNHRLALKDSNELTRDIEIPGTIDPVPSPDGKILTLPGTHFYLVEDVLAKGKAALPFYSDTTNAGVYQSVALVKIGDDPNIRTYRVVVDGTTNPKANYRDYTVNFNNTPPTVTAPLPVQAHCPNRELQTLFVSKTGKFLTGYDVATTTTKIFDMTDLTSAKRCREVLDLGYGTGKVEFNLGTIHPPEIFNFEDSDKKIAFHLDYFGSDVGSYFSGVQSDRSKDVYTMDIIEPSSRDRRPDWKLKTSNLRRLFSEMTLGNGGYYPSWTFDGKVVMIFDEGDAYSFRIADPERSKPYEFYLPPPAPSFEQAWADTASQPPQWVQRFHRAAAIGALWANECLVDKEQLAELTGVGAVSFFLGLSRENCTQMVRSRWDALKNQVTNSEIWGQDPRFNAQMLHEYSVSDLQVACEKIQDRLSFPPPVVIGQPSANHLTKDQMMHHYCMGCHVPGGQLMSITGESYPNTVDFTRGENNFPKTTLAHLLSSQRRVKTGLAAQENRTDPRPPDSMPPRNPIQTERTDRDHGEDVLSVIKEDIAMVTAMPKRVPLFLRATAPARAASAPLAMRESAPAGVVAFSADGNEIRSFSMPQVPLNRTTQKVFELVNNTDLEMTEVGANSLTGSGFFYPGNNLFPGTSGTCGATLAAHASCKFAVAFTPSQPQQLYRTSVQITFKVTVGSRNETRSVMLALDGIAAVVARN